MPLNRKITAISKRPNVAMADALVFMMRNPCPVVPPGNDFADALKLRTGQLILLDGTIGIHNSVFGDNRVLHPNHLRLFVEIVKVGSFAGAARRLSSASLSPKTLIEFNSRQSLPPRPRPKK